MMVAGYHVPTSHDVEAAHFKCRAGAVDVRFLARQMCCQVRWRSLSHSKGIRQGTKNRYEREPRVRSAQHLGRACR